MTNGHYDLCPDALHESLVGCKCEEIDERLRNSQKELTEKWLSWATNDGLHTELSFRLWVIEQLARLKAGAM